MLARIRTAAKPAYWDGKNEMGESVASGVYFYTLTAGDFSATRKMAHPQVELQFSTLVRCGLLAALTKYPI